MTTKSRILRNTLLTYGKLIFSAALALVGSRWVLSSLGHTDYGIYSLVGTLVVFVTALNSLMASSAARHLAYATGKNHGESVNSWFNASVGIHLALAAVLVVLAWPIGEHLVSSVFSLPPDRADTALVVFRLSLVAAFVSMISVPFIAMFTARQEFGELALWGVLQSMMTFCVAGSMLFVEGDLLWKYSLGVVLIGVFINCAQIYRATVRFSDCRLRLNLIVDREKYSEIFRFASWNLFGWFGVLSRDQGSAVLINLYFGPVANAAYAVAMQVSNQASQFSSALIVAFSPAINAKEGAGNRKEVLMLAQSASMFGTVLALLVAVPLIVTMEDILSLWLIDVPADTAFFCYSILLTFIIDRMSSGYMLAVQATGRIAAYQATVGLSLMCTLPIAWALIHFGSPPWTVGLAAVLTMSITSVGRAFWGKHMFDIPVGQWVKKVVLPCLSVALGGIFFGMFIKSFFLGGLVGVAVTGLSAVTTQLILAYYFVLSVDERAAVVSAFSEKLGRRS